MDLLKYPDKVNKVVLFATKHVNIGYCQFKKHNFIGIQLQYLSSLLMKYHKNRNIKERKIKNVGLGSCLC